MKHRIAVAVSAALTLTGAAAVAAESVFDTATSTAGVTFEFARVRTKIKAGEKIGQYATGSWCLSPKELLASTRVEEIANSQAAAAFKVASKALAVPVFEKDVSPFETNAPKNADYRLGGTLLRLYVDTCVDDKVRKGESDLEVKWEIWSNKLQRVVLSRTTTGRAKSENWETTFEYRAYVESLRELLTSPDVKALIAGVPPVVQEAFEALRLPATAAPGNADTQKSADALKKAVVTIMADSGTGSGFYIAEGYLLSNRHVVSSSRYVKVRLSDGREVVGEVIRQDAARDVALLKTAAVNLPTLALRATEPPVGENVFAIGSPFGQSLEGTFTRGVMSGLREFAGNRYYQSDVAVNAGNSGGPLLDSAGRVVGITQWGIPAAAGLSFFVPIKDALGKLNIAIEGAESTAATALPTAPR